MLDSLSDRLGNALGDLRSSGRLSEDDINTAMREIRLALLEADVNFDVVKQFVATVKERALGAEVSESLTPGQEVVKIVHDELTKLMGEGNTKLSLNGSPAVILVCGLQVHTHALHVCTGGVAREGVCVGARGWWVCGCTWVVCVCDAGWSVCSSVDRGAVRVCSPAPPCPPPT